jgi:hypothetical protein
VARPREHDPERERGGDDGEEDAERELGHRAGASPASDFHDLGLFGLDHLIDLPM